MTSRTTSALGFVVSWGFLATFAGGADWPHWRGPSYNGSSPEQGLPSTWSRTEGVVWSTQLPGPSEATPVAFGNQIFLSTIAPASDAIVALSIDGQNGKIAWQHQVVTPMRQDSRSTFGGPSPCTDGKHVYFFFGNGELVAYTLKGDQVWRRNIQADYGDFAFNWTFSSSPLLFHGTLYLQVLQRDVPVDGRGQEDQENKSYLLALDPATGKELWRTLRPSDAQEESRESFASPIPFEHEGRAEILVVGGDDISGHNPNNGEEFWRWGTWNPTRIPHWRLVPTPVAGAGVILACAPKTDPIYAVKAGATGRLTDSALAWVSRDEKAVSTDVPTPAFADGDFFVLSDVRKQLSRVDPHTGKAKWTVKTPGIVKYEASPLVADGKIYIINFAAEVAVFNAHNGDQLGVIPMTDPDHPHDGFNVRSSIIAAQGRLFIRTNSHLYCIAK
ncbi:MAG: PQQ-binding-like beta-propeller repeat protein [Planctomycetota bacterium]|nr:PQQ-binding-like beta-propeller repeat protein [Planctomycetota bacterium]MDA1180545.1 PQQ-binding-like beta-propeller repeat protein [Planctomycetota bacterium]